MLKWPGGPLGMTNLIKGKIIMAAAAVTIRTAVGRLLLAGNGKSLVRLDMIKSKLRAIYCRNNSLASGQPTCAYSRRIEQFANLPHRRRWIRITKSPGQWIASAHRLSPRARFLVCLFP
jgi:hypothetical protein